MSVTIHVKNRQPNEDQKEIPTFAMNRILKYVGTVSTCLAVSSTFVPANYTQKITFLKNSCYCKCENKLKTLSSLKNVTFINCYYVNASFIKKIVSENPRITNFVFTKCSHIAEIPVCSTDQQSYGTDVILLSSGDTRKLSFPFSWRFFTAPNPQFSPMEVLQIVAAAYSDRISGGLYTISDFFFQRSQAKMQLFMTAPYINEMYHYPFRVFGDIVINDKACIILFMENFSPVVFLFQLDANNCWKIVKGFQCDVINAWKRVSVDN